MPRRGIAVSEVRIIPVEYSDVMTMAPMTAMISWPRKRNGVRMACVASVPAACQGWLWMVDEMPKPIRVAMPTLTTNSAKIVQ